MPKPVKIILPQFKAVKDKFGFTQIAQYRSEKEKLYPDTQTVLEKLSRNYSLGIIANQQGYLRDRLREFGILHYFDHVISSADVGFGKPDIRIFKIALRQAECDPSHAVMIGDRIDNDIVPAKRLGMKTVWIKQGLGGLNVVRNECERADSSIDCLSDLFTLFNVK